MIVVVLATVVVEAGNVIVDVCTPMHEQMLLYCDGSVQVDAYEGNRVGVSVQGLPDLYLCSFTPVWSALSLSPPPLVGVIVVLAVSVSVDVVAEVALRALERTTRQEDEVSYVTRTATVVLSWGQSLS